MDIYHPDQDKHIPDSPTDIPSLHPDDLVSINTEDSGDVVVVGSDGEILARFPEYHRPDPLDAAKQFCDVRCLIVKE